MQVSHTLKHLLKECLDAVLAQPVRVSDLVQDLITFNILEHLEDFVFEIIVKKFEPPHHIPVV